MRFAAGRRSSPRNLKLELSDLTAEALEGRGVAGIGRPRARDRRPMLRVCGTVRMHFARADNAQINEIAQSGELEVLMSTYPDRSWCDSIHAASAGYR